MVGSRQSVWSPVVALSQYNRAAAKNGKATLADLRDSGAIEQDASVVLDLHSEHSPEEEDQMRAVERVVRILKNRNGARGAVRFAFDKGTNVWRPMKGMREDDL